MGKKSKGKAAPPLRLRCVECKLFMKSVDKGIECPGCDRLFCETCAISGRKGTVPFMHCHNLDCQSPSRCNDCAFGMTIKKQGEENKRRRERGDPPIVKDRKERMETDIPMSCCSNCFEILCHDCGTFQTKGYEGHYVCVGCFKTRCFKCCVESGDPKHFIMFCCGCGATKCSECDPGKTWDSNTGNYYCGVCSSDESIVSNQNGLVMATTMNKYMVDNGDKKLGELLVAPAGMPKYQYYQDDNFMKVQILEPNVLCRHLDVTFSPNELAVRIRKQEGKGLVKYTVIDGVLAHEVDVGKCKYIIKDEKVLIKLKKKEMLEWDALLDDKRSRNRQKMKRENEANAAQRSAVELAKKAPQASHDIMLRNDVSQKEEGVAEQHGDDRDKPDEVRLYVGNLDFATDEPRLRQVFEEFGTVTDVFIPTERMKQGNRRPLGFGFISLVTRCAADDAISKLDKTAVDGRVIQVHESKQRVENPADMAGMLGGLGEWARGLQNPLCCTHVTPHPLSQLDTQIFIKTYFTDLSRYPRSSSDHALNSNVVLKVMAATIEKYPENWMNDTKRKLIMNFFVALGVEDLLSKCLLPDSEFEEAHMAARVISTLETDTKTQHTQEKLKIRDALGGCTRSLYKFFIERMTCSCLDETYSKLKSERPKTGLCDHCKKRSERSNLFACSKCNIAQYCSRKCEIAHWPKHNCFHGNFRN
ncbi:hypothetical protein ACHAWF_009418 [Thalassiosira exigua]